MVQSEAIKRIEVREATEGWFWKAVSGVLATALAAIAVQAHGQLAKANEPASTAMVEQLQARVAMLEAAQKAPQLAPVMQADPAVAARLDRIEGRLTAIDEVDDWEEAARLGIARALASKGTGFSPKQEAHLAATIVREARAAHVDPLLVTSVMQVESGFNPYAVSNVGAVGLMQLMPATAGWVAKDDPTPPRGGHLFDLEKNVHLGCQYLAALIRQFGSVDRALVAYNMGPAAARKALSGPRAQALLAGYPRNVTSIYKRLLASGQPRPESKTLAAISRVERATDER